MTPSRPPWRERLGFYILGLAIGCLLVGALLSARSRALQKRRAEEAQRTTLDEPSREASTDEPDGILNDGPH